MAVIDFYSGIQFDVNGKYTMDFLSGSGQTFSSSVRNTYFASKHYGTQINDSSIYLRDNMPVVIGINIDVLRNANVNYMRFKNVVPDSSPVTYSRDYYAFITDMKYVKADATEITFEIDVLQTYLSDIYSGTDAKSVVRCHQDRWNDDATRTPIWNTISDIPSGQRKPTNIASLYPKYNISYMLVMCSKRMPSDLWQGVEPSLIQGVPSNGVYYYLYPFDSENEDTKTVTFYDNNGTRIISAGKNGVAFDVLSDSDFAVICSCQVLAFPPVDIQWTKTTSGNNINYTISNTPISQQAQGDVFNGFDISHNIFTYSMIRLTNSADAFKYTVATIGYTPIIPLSHISYTQNSNREPKHESKLFTSEYTPIHLTNYNTDNVYGYELFSNNAVTIKASSSIIGLSETNFILAGYNDDIKFVNNLRSANPGTLPFRTSALANYMASHSASVFGGLSVGLLNTFNMLDSKNKNTKKIGATEGFVENVLSLADLGRAPGKISASSSGAGANLSFDFIGGLVYAEEPIDYKPICDYWNILGYPLKEQKVVKDIIATRYWHNYIQTAEADFPNVSFAPHRRKLAELFNNGVTFWHNRSQVFRPFNNYDKENAELSLI